MDSLNNAINDYYAPASVGGGIKRRWPSSVCPASGPKSGTEERSKLKIGRKDVRDTG